MRRLGLVMLGLLVAAGAVGAQGRRAAATPDFFESPLTIEQMQHQQAVLHTAQGDIVLDLLPDQAPNHVAHFITTAKAGDYDGTIFHFVLKHGIIQGGDPLTRDPDAVDRYGSGGLNRLRDEPTDEPMTRGAVAAVKVPGKPDSAGTQFFIAITDQAALQGKYTVFARVAEGILVAQAISEVPVDAKNLPIERVVVERVTIRDRPAEVPPPFSTETVEELAGYHAVLETSMGDITLAFTPEVAPETVRNFLRLADAGVYDGMAWHRVVKGFVVQTGHLPTRREPLTEAQQKWVHDLPAEFNARLHEPGTVSMARLGDDPDSASTSFFIVTERSTMLDGEYTAFATVVDGMDVVRKIEAVPVNGEEPVERVELKTVRLQK
ncbi:MAG: peptidylprolyl isomerase [Vicinamibacterales bacterium]